LKENEK
jgi:hypothetical protein